MRVFVLSVLAFFLGVFASDAGWALAGAAVRPPWLLEVLGGVLVGLFADVEDIEEEEGP